MSVDEIPDFVLTVILSMLATADLLKAMVLSSFTPLPLTFKDCLQEVVVHHSTRTCCVGTQGNQSSQATR